MTTNPSDHKLIIFLDRDGTLNWDPGYIASVDQIEFYDDILTTLSVLSSHGFAFVIVTNQSGIGRGKIKPDELKRIHDYVSEVFRKNSISLLGIYHCPHHPDERCQCRKPGTDMLKEAALDHSIKLDESYIIGDSESDIIAGNTLGMKTILVRTGNGKTAEENLSAKKITVGFVGDTLSDCADYILNEGSIR